MKGNSAHLLLLVYSVLYGNFAGLAQSSSNPVEIHGEVRGYEGKVLAFSNEENPQEGRFKLEVFELDKDQHSEINGWNPSFSCRDCLAEKKHFSNWFPNVLQIYIYADGYEDGMYWIVKSDPVRTISRENGIIIIKLGIIQLKETPIELSNSTSTSSQKPKGEGGKIKKNPTFDPPKPIVRPDIEIKVRVHSGNAPVNKAVVQCHSNQIKQALTQEDGMARFRLSGDDTVRLKYSILFTAEKWSTKAPFILTADQLTSGTTDTTIDIHLPITQPIHGHVKYKGQRKDVAEAVVQVQRLGKTLSDTTDKMGQFRISVNEWLRNLDPSDNDKVKATIILAGVRVWEEDFTFEKLLSSTGLLWEVDAPQQILIQVKDKIKGMPVDDVGVGGRYFEGENFETLVPQKTNSDGELNLLVPANASGLTLILKKPNFKTHEATEILLPKRNLSFSLCPDTLSTFSYLFPYQLLKRHKAQPAIFWSEVGATVMIAGGTASAIINHGNYLDTANPGFISGRNIGIGFAIGGALIWGGTNLLKNRIRNADRIQIRNICISNPLGEISPGLGLNYQW